ncbi:hypothetical protein KEH51_09060 [[Brevibacterium] frigoritolerans]|uniref:Uncharacterized protein n=1 Tax=Peribacillus frigoritolerans TaxID=450367 RepID=A0A941J7E5_9BACI|nr:hypothetical protein [Peribacillus frigoritolerans]
MKKENQREPLRGKRAKVPKEKKDRKMIQPPPSQGKPRNSRNLKAIKVLMKKENQREPLREKKGKGAKGKKRTER